MSALQDGQGAESTTALCRLWQVRRRDGLTLGFTDHDQDLTFDAVVYRANSGLSASALHQASGLSVDNSEALGALSDAAITEADLNAGRYDGAEVRIWLVDWRQSQRKHELFRGTTGEITRRGASFRTELRGLSEALGQTLGAAYIRDCPAVLGDNRCRFDTLQPGYFCEIAVQELEEGGRVFLFDALAGFEPGWFNAGRLEMISGEAKGLNAMVKSDRLTAQGRRVDLWQSIRAAVVAGDVLRLTAGCDKRAETCRLKFANFLNFRGFPFLPSEDWLSAWPRPDQPGTGGSLLLRPGTTGF